MKISIHHVTRYDYATPVSYAVQRLRLTPVTSPAQRIVSWSIDAPGLESGRHYVDALKNNCHLVSLTGEITSFEVVAKGVVETTDTNGVHGDASDGSRAGVFLRETPLTLSNEAIRDAAAGIKEADELARLHAITNSLSNHMTFDTHATNEATDALTAFELGRGVCQDFTHIFIAMARELNIPARYITGYMVVDGDEAAVAQHAWAEGFVPNLGWIGFDAANGVAPTDHYVRLAAGFDAPSSAPISGNRRGGTTEAMTVEIAVAESTQ